MRATLPTVIVGAGPAGLTAAYELARLGRPAAVLEQEGTVGGLARTVDYNGYRFDIGGHRFFTKVEEVRRIWEDLLGDDLVERQRLSRIYYRGRFFDYPLRPLNALAGLGPVEAVRIAASFAAAQLFPSLEERTFEQWVANRFGRRLFEIFFKSYTEKVWGMSCREISSEWAAQRIKNLDLQAAVLNAVFGRRAVGGDVVTTLIDRFHYPRLGPGMMWERCRDRIAEAGVSTELGARVVAVHHDRDRVVAVEVERPDGSRESHRADQVISSMPLRDLVLGLDPPPPAEVRTAAERLRYRDFLTVVLIVDREDAFPDNWIYIHSPAVRVGRVQNFKRWSPEMVPDPRRTSLGLEYFVQEGDELWEMDDAPLVSLGARECGELGLLGGAQVVDGTVIRMPKAYPVYDHGYRQTLGILRSYLGRFGNLRVIGRNGQHRYNNQDHSMLAGLLAARGVAGERTDVWAVNVDPSYLEGEGSGRDAPAVPRGRDSAALLRELFARFDPVALGGAVGVVAGMGLAVATLFLVARGGAQIGPNLSLLRVFLPGFAVTWSGALLGAVEGALLGFVFGWVLARLINLLIGWEARALLRRLELSRALDPLSSEGES